MILVPDTNIYISSIISPKGQAGMLTRAWKEGRVKLALSEDILAEVEEVLGYDRIKKHHQWTQQRIASYLTQLRAGATVVNAPAISVVEADPTDDKFLACAVKAKADAVVTGDKKHLLPLKVYRGIPIITLRQCIDRLEKSAKQAA